MFPPLIWLAFVILVVAIVAIGVVWAMRAGLWLQETSRGEEPESTDPASGRTRRDREERRDQPPHHISTT